jgi:phosphohistidine phosphatase
MVEGNMEDSDLDLILWRHADAENGFPDASRALTDKGRKQAAKMANWLNDRLSAEARILVSPATRAQQTAEALGREFETVREIGPGADATSVLHAAGWPDASGVVLLVGHQPTLGRLASLLLFGQEAELSIKKAGIWWLTNRVRQDERQTVLRVVMAPEMV